MSQISQKLGDELIQILREKQHEDKSQQIPVIVSHKPETNLAELEKAGLKITRKHEQVNAVSGHISLRDTMRLAELPQVEKIEYDSEIQVF